MFQKSNGETVGNHKNVSKENFSAKKFVGEKTVFRNQMVKRLVIIKIFQRKIYQPKKMVSEKVVFRIQMVKRLVIIKIF